MRLTRRLIALFALAVGGCAAADLVAPLPGDTLRSAPTTVTVGGQVLTLAPYLWRNFQPGPSDQSALAAVLRVQAQNGAALTTTFHVTAAWVLYGEEQWATPVGEERLASPVPFYYEAVARNGPRWPTGATVDVVVRIRDASGAEHLLRTSGQAIQRAE